MLGYNEKYPSGLRKVMFWPPLSKTLTLDILPGKAYPFVPRPAKSTHYPSALN